MIIGVYRDFAHLRHTSRSPLCAYVHEKSILRVFKRTLNLIMFLTENTDSTWPVEKTFQGHMAMMDGPCFMML